jgi:hypothetical protein
MQIAIDPLALRDAFLAGRVTTGYFFGREVAHPTIHAVVLNTYDLRGSVSPPFDSPEDRLRHRDFYARACLTPYSKGIREFVQSPVTQGRLALEQAGYPEGSVDLIPEPDLVVAVRIILDLQKGADEVIREAIDRLSDSRLLLRPDYLADEDVFDPGRYLVVANVGRIGDVSIMVLNPLLDSAIAEGQVQEAWDVDRPDDWDESHRLYHAASLYPIANLLNAFLPRLSIFKGKLADENRQQIGSDTREAASAYLGKPVCKSCYQPLTGRQRTRCAECRGKLGGGKLRKLF